MGELINISDTSMSVRKAKELMLNFVKDNFGEEKYNEIFNFLNNCPVYVIDEAMLNGENKYSDAILDKQNVGAYITNEGLFIPEKLTKYNEENFDGFEKDVVLSTILHEYAHKLRKINSEYGLMFEEGFATIFAEACILYDRIKRGETNEAGVYTNTSYSYKKAEEQVRSILMILNQVEPGLDIKMIGEYIFGDENKFMNRCNEIFGNNFTNYINNLFTLSDLMNNEQILVGLLSTYMKNNNFSLEKTNDKNRLYNGSSYALSKAVVAVGKNAFSVEDQNNFKVREYFVKIADMQDATVDKERDERIDNFINEKYSLNNKSVDEIHDIVLDLCSEYIQRRESTKEENKMFIKKIEELIPNIDDFVKDVISINKECYGENFLEGIEEDNFTYEMIHEIIKDELKKINKNGKTL